MLKKIDLQSAINQSKFHSSPMNSMDSISIVPSTNVRKKLKKMWNEKMEQCEQDLRSFAIKDKLQARDRPRVDDSFVRLVGVH